MEQLCQNKSFQRALLKPFGYGKMDLPQVNHRLKGVHYEH